MKEEQSKSQEALAAKLEARRKRREQAEVAKLEKTAQLDADDELKDELRRRQQEESLLSSLDRSVPGGGGQSDGAPPPQLTG